MSTEEPVFPVMDGIATLPYFELWTAWSDHAEACGQCAFVMHETEDQARDALCWEGQTLNLGIKAKAELTRQLAALN